jgi:hypothetical protein
MTYVPNEGDAKEDEANADRRSFIKGAATTVGLLGAVGMIPTLEQSVAMRQESVEDQQAPPGLRPLAQPDGRFPMTYEASVPEAMRLVTQYFAALTRRDLQGMAQTLHYPFVTYEGIEAVVVDSADKLMADPPQSMNVIGKGENLIGPGTYDILEHIELLIYNPIGAGLSLDYSRYRANGQRILACNGIYGVTNNDGKWGIEYLSTIFTPANQIGETYDGEAVLKFMHDEWRDHDLGRKYNDVDQMRRSSAILGRQAMVFIGGSNSTSRPAAEGKPMEPYRVKGVKSRLRITETTQEEIDHPSAAVRAAETENMAQFHQWSGGGVGKWAYSLEFSGATGQGSCLLHAGTDKAHVYTGYIRYTADGTVISETRLMETVVYQRGAPGRWGHGGLFGEMMYRDCTNDVGS